MTKDPVCEMPIEAEESEYQKDYNEKTYYFCSELCKEEFENDPEKYLKNIDLGDDYEMDHIT